MHELGCMAMALLALSCVQVGTPQSVAKTKPAMNEERALMLINAHRASHGLPSLTIDARLTAAARVHAKDLSRRYFISHQGSDGTYPKDRARRAGYRPKLASENIAAGPSKMDDVIKAWKLSRGHNENLLRRQARHMGMALVYDPKSRKQTYWTLLVGTPQ